MTSLFLCSVTAYIVLPVYVWSGTDTFCPGGQNVAARFSPTLQYMVRARIIRGRSFSPGGQNVAARFSPTCTLQYGGGQDHNLCSSVHEAWGLLPFYPVYIDAAQTPF